MSTRLGMACPWDWVAWRAIGDADIVIVFKRTIIDLCVRACVLLGEQTCWTWMPRGSQLGKACATQKRQKQWIGPCRITAKRWIESKRGLEQSIENSRILLRVGELTRETNRRNESVVWAMAAEWARWNIFTTRGGRRGTRSEDRPMGGEWRE